ncbi:MAG: N-acetyltransferase [Tannerella sp.]|jgi:predicted GNAT family acetyltransferase|nr:N-acetyltransferase [Tannerella sp.]
MEIKKRDNGKKGAFIAVENDMEIGEMTYVWANDYRIIIDHTEVDSLYEGRGVGKELFMYAVEFARENNVSIIPVCPFAKAMFRRFPETNDVLIK